MSAILLLIAETYADPTEGIDGGMPVEGPDGGTPAEAPDGGTPGEVPDGGALAQAPAAGFAVGLADAKTLYFQGRNPEALAALEALRLRLDAGEEVAWEDETECLLYLGELRHVTGDDEGARTAFRRVLEQDVEYPISPYEHGMEVVGLYETVRRAIQQERAQVVDPLPDPPPLPLRTPLPAWGFAPLGIPQFSQRQWAKGSLYATAQLGAGIASLTLYAQLRHRNVGKVNWPEGWTEDNAAERIQTARFAMQWPATFAFYGLWITSYVDATVSWKRHWAVRIAPTPVPDGGGIALGVSRGW